MEVDDATGIVPNLAIDRGDGTAIYVTNVTGSTVSITGGFTTNLTANTCIYTNIAPTSTLSITE